MAKESPSAKLLLSVIFIFPSGFLVSASRKKKEREAVGAGGKEEERNDKWPQEESGKRKREDAGIGAVGGSMPIAHNT